MIKSKAKSNEITAQQIEAERNKAYLLMARIKFMIDRYYDFLKDEEVIEQIDAEEIIGDIYDEIDKNLPKKYLIAEKLDIDDKERKILDALRKPKHL